MTKSRSDRAGARAGGVEKADATGRVAYSYRADPCVPSFPDDLPLILFDGECVMCSAGAQFVLRRDRAGLHRLAVTQSPLGRALYAHYGLDADATNLLIADGRAYTRSAAVIGVARRLGWPWSLLSVGRVVPRFARDSLYGLVARNRIRWFGRREVCLTPPPDAADRFLA